MSSSGVYIALLNSYTGILGGGGAFSSSKRILFIYRDELNFKARMFSKWNALRHGSAVMIEDTEVYQILVACVI